MSHSSSYFWGKYRWQGQNAFSGTCPRVSKEFLVPDSGNLGDKAIMSQNNTITVTVRSHVRPSANINNFEFGKPLQVTLEYNATLEMLLQKLFLKSINELGFVAVNNKIAKRDRILLDGDVVFVFSLVTGG